jgi:hypothetical protein
MKCNGDIQRLDAFDDYAACTSGLRACAPLRFRHASIVARPLRCAHAEHACGPTRLQRSAWHAPWLVRDEGPLGERKHYDEE